MNGATKLPSSKKHFRKRFPHFCADGTTNFGIQRFCFASFGIFCSFDNKTLYDWPLMARLFVNIWPFITKNWTQQQQNCKSKFKILSNTKLTLKNCPRLLQIRLMCLHCYTNIRRSSFESSHQQFLATKILLFIVCTKS